MGHSCFDVSFTLMGIIDFFGFPKEMGWGGGEIFGQMPEKTEHQVESQRGVSSVTETGDSPLSC